MRTQTATIRGREIILRDRQSMTSAKLHAVGAVLSLFGMAYLIIKNLLLKSSPLRTAAMGVYGFSLVSLYTASTLYHIFYLSDRAHAIFRKVDHIMIFCLIAGSYTPLCLLTIQGKTGGAMFAAVWSIAIAGTFMKLFWISAPRWLSAGIYVLMGWMALFALPPILHNLPFAAVALLFAGGVVYSAGAVIYALKIKIIHTDWFGNHELFHIFVLLGSFCHYLLISTYV